MIDYYEVFLATSRYIKSENKNLDKRWKAKEKEGSFSEGLVILNSKALINDSAMYLWEYLDSMLEYYSSMDENNDGTYHDNSTADYDDDGNIKYDHMLDWMIKDFEEYMYEGWEKDINFVQNQYESDLLEIENIRNASMLLIAADWYLKLVYRTKDGKPKPGTEIYRYVESLKEHMSDTYGGLIALTAQSIISLKDATAEDAENASQSYGYYVPLPDTILYVIGSEAHISLPNNLSSLEPDINAMEEIGQIIATNVLPHELCGAVSYAMGALAHYEDYDPYEEEGLFREAKEMFSASYMRRLVGDPKRLPHEYSKYSFGDNRLKNQIASKTRRLKSKLAN